MIWFWHQFEIVGGASLIFSIVLARTVRESLSVRAIGREFLRQLASRRWW